MLSLFDKLLHLEQVIRPLKQAEDLKKYLLRMLRRLEDLKGIHDFNFVDLVDVAVNPDPHAKPDSHCYKAAVDLILTSLNTFDSFEKVKLSATELNRAVNQIILDHRQAKMLSQKRLTQQVSKVAAPMIESLEEKGPGCLAKMACSFAASHERSGFSGPGPIVPEVRC